MINYKNLHSFWVVAREVGVARAGERLHLTPQTISGQPGLLEDPPGATLFTRVGRDLELTETGLRLVSSYAGEIFTLGSSGDRRRYALHPFREFAWKLTGDPNWRDAEDLCWINDSFRHLGVRF